MSFATWLQMLKWNYNLVESSGHIRFCEHLSVDCFHYGRKLYVASQSPSSCPQYSTLNDMPFANNQSAHLRQLQKQLFSICNKIFPYTSYVLPPFRRMQVSAGDHKNTESCLHYKNNWRSSSSTTTLMMDIWKEWKLCTIPMKEFNVVRMQL